jgi:hypothetical protein
MIVFRKLFFVFLLLALTAGCKNKKKKPSLSGEEPVEISDFIAFFQPLKLPYQLNDSILNKKEKDSLLISYKVFTQFVPDSILTSVFGKGVKPKLYPLGSIPVNGAETYLFVKALATGKKAAYILAFDKKSEFITALPALRSDPATPGTRTITMDRKFIITKNTTRKNKDGTTSEGREVFTLSPESREFTLVMTDALEDRPTELINPIDTFSRKNKLSGDYTTGKMNLVSIRDGRKADRLSFFIHFEKNNGECSGELKGEARIRSATTAEYRQDGDPCVLKFNFTSNAVTLTEVEGCGAHRGLRCSFNGRYPVKKVSRPATKPAKRK